MSDPEISHEERLFLQESVDSDRPQLFALAHQVIARAIERRWDAVISDATRGILVGRFLAQILSAEAQSRGRSQPPLVHIANSRHMYAGVLRNGFSEPSRGHSWAITNYLKPLGFERPLVATDMVDSGKCLRKLGSAVVRAGMAPDFAILATPRGLADVRRKIRAPRKSEIYAVTSGVEPMLAGDTVSQGLGVWSVYGKAEPQPSPYAWPWIGEVASQLYEQLADEYIGDRLA